MSTFEPNAIFCLAGDKVTMIKSLDYHMSNRMKQAIWDSCKDVVNPATGKPAVGFMCGIWGDYCDADKLFEFIGSYGPFRINYR